MLVELGHLHKRSVYCSNRGNQVETMIFPGAVERHDIDLPADFPSYPAIQ
jgi:hypothetical protein